MSLFSSTFQIRFCFYHSGIHCARTPCLVQFDCLEDEIWHLEVSQDGESVIATNNERRKDKFLLLMIKLQLYIGNSLNFGPTKLISAHKLYQKGTRIIMSDTACKHLTFLHLQVLCVKVISSCITTCNYKLNQMQLRVLTIVSCAENFLSGS